MEVVLFVGKTGLSEAGGFAFLGKAVLVSEFSLRLGGEFILGSQCSQILLVLTEAKGLFREERAMG